MHDSLNSGAEGVRRSGRDLQPPPRKGAVSNAGVHFLWRNRSTSAMGG